MRDYTIFKQLLKIQRLSNKRDPNYGANKVMRILGFIFAILLLLLFTALSIMVFIDSETYEDIEPLQKALSYGVGAALVYEIFMRALISLNKPPENSFAFFILPYKKKKIILFKQIITTFSWLTFFIAIYITPFLLNVAYFYHGWIGILESLILILLLFALNKQISDFSYYNFKKHKVISIIVIACYIMILLTPILFKSYAIFEKTILYTLVSYHSYFFLNFIILVIVVLALLYINNRTIYNQTLDDIQESGTVKDFSFINKLTDRLGDLGSTLKNDLKLVLRTKQLRLGILVILAMPIFMFFLYNRGDDAQQVINKCLFIFALSFSLTPLSIMPYESYHLGFYTNKQFDIRNLIISKYIVNLIAALCVTIPILIYLLINQYSILLLSTIFMFSTGIASVITICIYYGFNTIAINPHKKSRATNSTNFLSFICIIGVPGIIALFFTFVNAFDSDIIYYTIIAISLLSMLMIRQWAALGRMILRKRKHKILDKIMNN